MLHYIDVLAIWVGPVVCIRQKWLIAVALAAITWALPAQVAPQWSPLGPDGGDARALAYDPNNPQRILLGTTSGELFVSGNAGRSWSRLAHLGSGSDYVLDNIVFDSNDSNTVYVAAWSVDNPNRGDVFRSRDGGRTWTVLTEVSGKSVRALALAPSNSRVVVAGALDGVYRSDDAGRSWRQISPPDHAEIKNIESIAIDPANPDVIYAGTWHLPWKTEDGGRSWHSIKEGVVDDSDVFSIIIDPRNSATLFLSACTGIYRSDNAGELFRKVQGIPESARRTRVLQEDPTNSAVVFAGTTEGLWRTIDGGGNWGRLTNANLIVNDILIDPRNPSHILIAIDRGGVLASHNGGFSFRPSNRGFAHRQVTSLVVDANRPEVLYAGVINDKEFGGVFKSMNGGKTWTQISLGLGGRDVFSLQQSSSGLLIAGTNDGMFGLGSGQRIWRSVSTWLRAEHNPAATTSADVPAQFQTQWKVGEITGRISQVRVLPANNVQERWFAGGAEGVFRSLDQGRSWTGGPVLGRKGFVSMDGRGDFVVAATGSEAFLSGDGGTNWTELNVPASLAPLSSITLTPEAVWVATRLGAFRSTDGGKNWTHISAGKVECSGVRYDDVGKWLACISERRDQVFQSADGGQSWKLLTSLHRPARTVFVSGPQMFAITDFDGIFTRRLPPPETRPATSSLSSAR